ncbi:hypothetical protein SAMN04487890_12270 [Mucilaginibacter polytrichastri]|nr:hypothetical protein SAMN04487890_12270 [Mucilaginibacter polytrichastri]
MSYKVRMGNGTEQTIKFISAEFKNLIVWNVSFDTGQKAMLYKLGNEWMQHNESDLDSHSLLTIGEQIDHSLL